MWKLKGHGTDVVVPVTTDAGPTEQFGVMEIDPKPNGAHVTITGVDGIAHEFGPTPTRSGSGGTRSSTFHIELAQATRR